MKNNKPLYKVILYITEDKRHSPYIVGGLLDLERVGFIVLKFKSMPIIFKNRYKLSNGKFSLQNKGYPWCPEMVIVDIKTKKKTRVGIDLQDWTELFSFHSFNNCDLIYKRALTKESLKLIDRKFPKLVKPFGPNRHSVVNDSRYLRYNRLSYKKQLISKAICEPAKIFRKIKSFSINGSSSNKIIISKDSFTTPPKHNYIFFQVQFHDWYNQDSDSINLFRANIIRSLKDEFKDRFFGGMWFKNRVDTQYEDCITNVDTNYESYIDFINNAAIVISTNGFGGSIPWKLVEYMELGCCIVSERNDHLFRVPLDKNIISFYQTEDECVQLCNDLLDDNNVINKKKISSAEYYSRCLDPSVIMKQIILNSSQLA